MNLENNLEELENKLVEFNKRLKEEEKKCDKALDKKDLEAADVHLKNINKLNVMIGQLGYKVRKVKGCLYEEEFVAVRYDETFSYFYQEDSEEEYPSDC